MFFLMIAHYLAQLITDIDDYTMWMKDVLPCIYLVIQADIAVMH